MCTMDGAREDEHPAGDGDPTPPSTPLFPEFSQPVGPADVPAAPPAGVAPPEKPPRRPVEPELPEVPAVAPPPMVAPSTRPVPGSSTWYRTDEDRNRSVYRRANPWYRRVARGVIGVTLLGLLGVGVYVGARAVQDYFDRDRLPAPGVDIPEVRSTTFLVTSSSPAPAVDGTLTLDADTGAFEFVGRATGPQSGVQLASPDGSTVYLRRGNGPWSVAGSSDGDANAVGRAVRYLSDDDTADDILTNRLRRGYVTLDRQVDEGVGDDRLTRYEMRIDTRSFSADYPIQWQEFRDDAIPGVREESALPVTIWLDTDGLLVRVRDDSTGWAWERLASTDQPFVVEPPDTVAADVVRISCAAGDVVWQTPLPTCDGAFELGRALALTTGVVADAADPAADLAVATLCLAMERDEPPVPVSAEEAALATALVDSGVCAGDPGVFSVAESG